MFWLFYTAMAAEFAVVSEQVVLQPGLPGPVWIAVTDVGHGEQSLPSITIEGGTAKFASQTPISGVWKIYVTPFVEVPAVRLGVSVGGQTHHTNLLVRQPAPVPFTLPKRVDAVIGADEVSVLLKGENLPSADDLEVVVAEGKVLAKETSDMGDSNHFFARRLADS